MVGAVGQEYKVTLCTQVMCSAPSHTFAGSGYEQIPVGRVA